MLYFWGTILASNNSRDIFLLGSIIAEMTNIGSDVKLDK